MKIRPVGAMLFLSDTQRDRQTDMKLIVARRSLTIATKKDDDSTVLLISNGSRCVLS